MSLQARIRQAVTPLVPEFAADVYTGDAQSYCTLQATQVPVAFGDNRPHAVRYLAQLHWYFPLWADPTATMRALRAAIGTSRGCTWPTVTDAGDLDGGHLVFEVDAVDGEVDGGA